MSEITVSFDRWHHGTERSAVPEAVAERPAACPFCQSRAVGTLAKVITASTYFAARPAEKSGIPPDSTRPATDTSADRGDAAVPLCAGRQRDDHRVRLVPPACR